MTDTATESKDLLGRWDEIRTLVESMDLDVRKNAAKSNQSAGLRARRALRLLKKLAHELLMASVAQGKQPSAEKKDES